VCFPDLNTLQLQPHWKRVYAARKAQRTKANRYGKSWEWENPLPPVEEEVPVGKGRYCGECGERRELHVH
jgi:hypothetical protein